MPRSRMQDGARISEMCARFMSLWVFDMALVYWQTWRLDSLEKAPSQQFGDLLLDLDGIMVIFSSAKPD